MVSFSEAFLRSSARTPVRGYKYTNKIISQVVLSFNISEQILTKIIELSAVDDNFERSTHPEII